ncbi:hypothetical protein GCM10020001_000790 [Nonomuraea salmonea]
MGAVMQRPYRAPYRCSPAAHRHQALTRAARPSEIYLKPASSYVRPGVAANFATVLESAIALAES